MAFINKITIFTLILKYKILPACIRHTTVPELPEDLNSNFRCSDSVEERGFFFFFLEFLRLISSQAQKPRWSHLYVSQCFTGCMYTCAQSCDENVGRLRLHMRLGLHVCFTGFCVHTEL